LPSAARSGRDGFVGRTLDYLIANPPYGKDWKGDEEAVRQEYERGAAGRFGPGLPRISDGRLLFLLHMLAHRKAPEEGGSRIAIIMNGSPLFTGDAGSGESEIRRYVLEHDLLEALIALPEHLFYNTGISTYVWVLTNRKAAKRRGKVQLIDASSFWVQMRKSLGDKRREVPLDRAEEVVRLLRSFQDGETRPVKNDEGVEEQVVVSRVYPTTYFGYRKITVERPLRLEFQVTPERIARLDQQRAFQALAESRRKGSAAAAEVAAGRARQEEIQAVLRGMPERVYRDRETFTTALGDAYEGAGIALSAPVLKSILTALGERSESAEICHDRHGNLEPRPRAARYRELPARGERRRLLRARGEAACSRRVGGHDAPRRPRRWGGGRRYEINFNRYFYRYRPPRPLEEIDAELRLIERVIVRMLAERCAEGAVV
jgi:type I restriction enzyme M protein